MLERLVVFVEEPSMEAALHILLPRMLDETDYEVHAFQCKNDLLKRLPARLRGYRRWLPPTWAILVLVDRDADDCRALKAELEDMAARAGLLTKTAAGADDPFQAVNRLAVEEVEAWFFGDWQAVRAAYPAVSARIPGKAPYREPDGIAGGTWEALERVLKRAGYFRAGLRKVECARAVAAHMDPGRNRSRSFQAFVGAVSAARACGGR